MNIEKIARECGLYDDDQEPLTEYLQQFANAILKEAKKEEADKQKPVAHQGWCASLTQQLTSNPPKPAPCNCSPLAEQREWVGLTDEEIDEAVKSCNTTDIYKYFRAIEAKLKEKNNAG